MTAIGQPLVETTIAGQPLGGIIATVKLMDLLVRSMLKSQENQKVKNWLSPENYLSQENQKAKNRKNR